MDYSDMQRADRDVEIQRACRRCGGAGCSSCGGSGSRYVYADQCERLEAERMGGACARCGDDLTGQDDWDQATHGYVCRARFK